MDMELEQATTDIELIIILIEWTTSTSLLTTTTIIIITLNYTYYIINSLFCDSHRLTTFQTKLQPPNYSMNSITTNKSYSLLQSDHSIPRNAMKMVQARTLDTPFPVILEILFHRIQPILPDVIL